MRAVAKALDGHCRFNGDVPSLVVDSGFDHAPFRLVQPFVFTPFCLQGVVYIGLDLKG